MSTLTPEAAERLDAAFAVDPIERDRPWQRPLLVPTPERAANLLVEWPKNRKPRTDGKVPYTRASTFSSYVADHSALATWNLRSTVHGLGQREDLAARVAALPPLYSNFKSEATLTKQERADDKLTKAVLDEVAYEAARYANRDFKADWGTAIHGLTDPGPHGPTPERMRADVESWQRATASWTIHATEVFVACDRWQVAGTFDHLVEIPWRPDLGAIVVDKKTGLLHPHDFGVQMQPYVNGEVYDGWNDTRAPLESLTGGVAVNRDFAIIAHIPMGLGRTDFYLVDLKASLWTAELAAQVRADRSRPDDDFMVKVDFLADRRLEIAGAISAATNLEELIEIRAKSLAGGTWCPELQTLGTSKRSEFAS